VGVPVVASGGAGSLEHMAEVLLEGRATPSSLRAFSILALHRRRREQFLASKAFRCDYSRAESC